MVLCGIEHLQERGGGVAAPVGADLVDLVEHEDRVSGLGPPEPLDDAARHRPDVRSPVASNLRFVPDPAQRHAHEPPSQRPGDALPEARLAHARRADEAEDRLPRGRVARHARRLGRRGRPAVRRRARPLGALLAELLHREVLEDPILDLVQVEVVLVQHLAGAADVDGPAGDLAPGQAGHPLEIRDDHAVLRRRRRDGREAGQLALGLAPGLFRKAGFLDLPAELGDLGVPSVLLPQFLLDGPELFPQIELTLSLREPLLGVGRDLAAQLAHGEVALQQVDQPAKLGRDRVHLEQLPSGGRIEGNHRRDEVHQVPGIVDALHGRPEGVGQVRRGFYQLSEEVHDRAPETIHLGDLRRRNVLLGRGLDAGHQVRLRPDQVQEADPLEALDHQPHATVGSPGELVDHPGGADGMEVGQRRRLPLGVALGHEREQPVAAHDIVDQPDRAGLSHGKGKSGQREHHRVPDGQHRQRVGDGELSGVGPGLGRSLHQRVRFGSLMRSRPRS